MRSDPDQMMREAARIAAPVFADQGWEWAGGDGMFVPDAVDIYATLRRLRSEIITRGDRTVLTGRLRLERLWDDEDEQTTGDWVVSLQLGIADMEQP